MMYASRTIRRGIRPLYYAVVPNIPDHQESGRAGQTLRVPDARPVPVTTTARDGALFADTLSDRAAAEDALAPIYGRVSLTTSPGRSKGDEYEALAYGRVIPTAPICAPFTAVGGGRSRPKPELSAPGTSRGPWAR